MKKKLLAAGLALATVFLSGCGTNTKTDENTVEEVKTGSISSISFSSNPNIYYTAENTVKLYYLTHNGKQIPYDDFYPLYIELKYKNNDSDTLTVEIEDESVAKFKLVKSNNIVSKSDIRISKNDSSTKKFIGIYPIPLKDGTTTLTVTSNEGITNDVKIIVKHGCNIVTRQEQFTTNIYTPGYDSFTLYDFYGSFYPCGANRLYFTAKKLSGPKKSAIGFNYTLSAGQTKLYDGRPYSGWGHILGNDTSGLLSPGDIFNGSFGYGEFSEKPIQDDLLPIEFLIY